MSGADISGIDTPVRLIVLAGQGRTPRDGLAQRFSVSHKCLVPLGGKPMIAHVLQTAAAHPRIASLVVSIEPEAFEPVYDVLTTLPGRGTIRLAPAKANIADSVAEAAAGWEGRILVTSADHALLDAETIEAMIAALDRADLALALVSREQVLAVHPSAGRHFHQFRDGGFADGNLYGSRGAGMPSRG